MTFNIWYRLSEYLYQRDNNQLNMVFRPYIERYIFCLYKHCRFDTDHEGIPDENEEFTDFRQKTIETLKDVVFVVTTDSCIRSVILSFHNYINQIFIDDAIITITRY